MLLKRTIVMVMALAFAGPAQAADRVMPPAVPGDIAAPDGVRPFLAGHAIGTQNYMCAPAAGGGLDWFFLGPQATVFDTDFLQRLTHFLSPNQYLVDTFQATWQHSDDSSRVWAKKRSGSTDPRYVAPDAIEWLALDVTGTALGPTGGNRLALTKFIHRVNTVGGLKPPTSECTAATINTRKLVYYEADYYFYR
jgi:Protein of unknown function (DUF3455)